MERKLMKLKKVSSVSRADTLYFFLLGLATLFLVLGALSFNLWILAVAVFPIGACIFRLCSKNIAARKKENERFCRMVNTGAKFLEGLSYDTEECMRICPECGAKLDLGPRDGVFYVSCPKCGHRFLVDFS